jgi:hypothetical protein
MPRHRIREDDVYQFDELSDRAKERARDWFRGLIDASDIGENVIEDATRMAEILGIDMRTRTVKLLGGGTRQEPNVYWDLGNGGGAAYDGSYSYQKGSVQKIKAEAPAEWTNQDGTKGASKENKDLQEIAETLQEVQRRNFYQVQASIRHSGRLSMSIEVERADGKEFALSEDANIVEQALEDFASWIHARLQAEEKYRYSAEVVDEDIRANEYEFTEDGDCV